MTGIPMKEATVVDPPAPLPPGGLQGAKQDGAASGAPDISVLQVGKRLQITADVDKEGLAKFKRSWISTSKF
jgi:hypothetical protein